MRIRWTEPAARDLTGICDYIKEHDGPAAASRVALEIYGGVGARAQFAHRGRPGRKTGTRELVFPGLPFLAVYRVRNDVVVEITRILHGAQKWP
jgi:toxin ParE1/3/4